jgi:hypothetical protein
MPRYTMDPEDWREIERERRIARQARQGSPPAREAAEASGCESVLARPWLPLGRLCAYCLAPLRNGASYCSDDCREGMFAITCIWPAD